MPSDEPPIPTPPVATPTEAPSATSPGAENPPPGDHDDRLIRWMLAQSPTRRLEVLQEWANGVGALRDARKITE